MKNINPDMDDEIKDIDKEELTPNDTDAQAVADDETTVDEHSDYKPVNRFDASAVHHLSGMYQNWFLDYASYVILERAVPHIDDGLKPVQRRILHSMKRMDDGRFNKVANIVGYTMQFHPHGDASIKDALVQLGQKDLLVECQGNWGNIITGDDAAAGRYIEARLSKLALDVVFNPKTTEWQMSYDGRNKEPVTLPVKYPLLLAQGAEGIAVGLSSKILPHNFCEICDAAISYLRGEEFRLYPDFPTGGSIDVSKYNDGQRGGVVKVRAKIEKLDQKTLVIREIPFGKTTGSPQKPSPFIESILKAAEKGKIKVRKVEDLTAAGAEILIHLAPGVSSDKTIDALYAFTDCEINISPNCCVIEDNKPKFLTVSEVLQHSVDRTMGLLRMELQIRRGELMEQLFFASLERIFIEERIYKDKQFEEAENVDAVVAHIDERLTPFKPQLVREVTRDDILRLLEIKMQRILKFNKDKADELIKKIKKEIKGIDRDLAHMTDVTINWFTFIKDKYGKDHPRLTEIRNFDTIEAAKVAEANQKLYINRQEGFIGTSLKKDEFVCNCSDIDDIIIFYKDGKYKVIRVAEKIFIGKNVMHVQVYKKNDKRTIYNAVYRDGKKGPYYIKRFFVCPITRDKEYDITQGKPGSKIMYFTANPNGEAESIKISLDPSSGRRNLLLVRDFSEVAIKSRTAKGNLVTKYQVQRIGLKSHGHSTLGGRKVWFDPDINRINYEEHGKYLGEFNDDEFILVILENMDFYFTNIDVNNHYDEKIRVIEKYDEKKTWTLMLYDADNKGLPYLKRFVLDYSKKRQSLLGENKESKAILLTDTPFPRLQVIFGGADAVRTPMEIDAEQFIGVKNFKARGKRVTTWTIDNVEELEPLRWPEPEVEAEEIPDDDIEPEAEEVTTDAPATTPAEPEQDVQSEQNVEELAPEVEEEQEPELTEPAPEIEEEQEQEPIVEIIDDDEEPIKPVHQNPNDIPIQLSLFPDEDEQ